MTTSESKGQFFFYKTNRFESIRITNRIANWNALFSSAVRQLATGTHCNDTNKPPAQATLAQKRQYIYSRIRTLLQSYYGQTSLSG